MFKKRKISVRLAAFLLAYATIVSTFGWGGCIGLIGEPQLPKKMLKEDSQ